MARGDHVFVHRTGYTHHGIDLGDGTVMHYTGEVGQKTNAAVRLTPIEEFANGADVHVQPYGRCDSIDVTLERARGRLGETKYHLAFNNCEHFARWCKTGDHRSAQVDGLAATGAGTVTTGAAVAAGLGAVSATGAVAGLSASGMMSGLATVGAVVGGGAAAGIAVVGAAPAAVTTAAMNYVLKDDPVLHEKEREARRAGRYATIAGGVGGTAAAVSAVSAAGVTGLSAAGITSGLAAIGATVGGGMAAGVAIAAAGPAVAAAAAGYGAYRLWKHFRRGPASEKSIEPKPSGPAVYGETEGE